MAFSVFLSGAGEPRPWPSSAGAGRLWPPPCPIEGSSLADVIASRIITPLGLKEMRVPTSTSSVADIAPPVSDTAEPAIDITVPGAAGPLAASARDMLLFQQAFLDGRLLKAATRARSAGRALSHV